LYDRGGFHGAYDAEFRGDGLLGGLATATAKAIRSRDHRPVPVAVAKATEESVPTELRVVGTVEASAIVTVPLANLRDRSSARPSPKGRNVKQGDLLFQIRPAPV